jgi:hypothetical protein
MVSPEAPTQQYAELIKIRGQERLARRVARERKSIRLLARRPVRRESVISSDAGVTYVPAR